MRIGVLALQGAVAEHIRMFEQEGAEAVIVKRIEQLEDLDGLAIPGGESTTIGKLMREYGFIDAIHNFAKSGKPIFGTCAGLILIAKHIEPDGTSHLGLMDIHVHRNGFGRQRESFEADLEIKGLSDPFRAVFIRAPYILEIEDGVEPLCYFEDKLVAARQGQYLCSAFHPELTDDSRMHAYFIEMIKEYQLVK